MILADPTSADLSDFSAALQGLSVTVGVILGACYYFAIFNINFSVCSSLGNCDHKLDTELPARSASPHDENITKGKWKL
jgi:hypothetical protein